MEFFKVSKSGRFTAVSMPENQPDPGTKPRAVDKASPSKKKSNRIKALEAALEPDKPETQVPEEKEPDSAKIEVESDDNVRVLDLTAGPDEEGHISDTWDSFVDEISSRFSTTDLEGAVADNEVQFTPQHVGEQKLPEEFELTISPEIDDSSMEGRKEALQQDAKHQPVAEANPLLTPEVLEIQDPTTSTSVLRLIQRFPPDVVEMMQVELGRKDFPLIVNGKLQRLVRSIANCRKVHQLEIDHSGKILSEAYYSRANVICLLVCGTRGDLRKFFTSVRNEEVPVLQENNSYMARFNVGVELTLYMVGLNFEEMDSFEGENLLDRGNGCIVIIPEAPEMADIAVDALSLAMVKYQRQRVFVVYGEEYLPSQIMSACSAYSVAGENRTTGIGFTSEAFSALMERVSLSLSSHIPVS
jgi:hypothetical protein